MSAAQPATLPLKPTDIVETPAGRVAEVTEVLPFHERGVKFLDDEGGEAEFRESQLRLLQRGEPRPWRERKP